MSQDLSEKNGYVIYPQDIFLHFIDHEFLTLTYLDRALSDAILQQMRRAMVVALLVANNHVYMPASAYFESHCARSLFNWFPQFRQFGILRLVGNAFSIGDFVEAKRSQYAKDYNRYPRYFNDREIRRLLSTETNWLRRSASTTRDIKAGWLISVNEQESIWDSLARRHGMTSLAGLEANLLAVPERLGNMAFIADYVLPLLQLTNLSSCDMNEINAFITQKYIKSYIKEFSASCLVDLPFADSRPVLGKLTNYISYRRVLHLWRILGIDNFLLNASDSDLIGIRITDLWSMFLRKYCWPYSLQDTTSIANHNNLEELYLHCRFKNHLVTLDEVLKRLEAIVKLPKNVNGLGALSEQRFIVSRAFSEESLKLSPNNIERHMENLTQACPSLAEAKMHCEAEASNVELSLSASQKVKIFFAYSQQDEGLRERLEKHLSELKRQHQIVWCDKDLSPGQERAKKLEEGLSTAHIILLLVSADFLASDYCYHQQMKLALERHEAKETCIIPIILRPVDWKITPLGKLKALPCNGKAVTSWKKTDDALLDIVIGIRKSVEQVQQNLLS